MKPILDVRHISKKFRIHHEQKPYLSLRESLSSLFKTKASADEDFWALSDVSFSVNAGESIGIIGKNGAGKSTLLKVLSRITPPSSGSVTIRGRMASLLEVGTGFHPELTGRENIFLNGSILGMKKREILQKFDEIVDFSGVERFLDTPLKHYSSGMQLRLAFAVAAFLEPEILVIDEVLAVGDAEFQKKCLGKMESVSRSGRTVLFVSHNTNAVLKLCNKAIFLQKGKLIQIGTSKDVISSYLQSDVQEGCLWNNERGEQFNNPYFKPLLFKLADREEGQTITTSILASKDIDVFIEGWVDEINPLLTMGICISVLEGTPLFWSYHTDLEEPYWPKIKKGLNKFKVTIPAHFLNEGDYYVELIGGIHFSSWICEPGISAPCLKISVQGGLSKSPYWISARPGYFAPILKFEQYD